MGALASFSAFINLLNLIPVWRLDGGQAIAAITRTGRICIALASLVFAAYFSQPFCCSWPAALPTARSAKSFQPRHRPAME